MTKSGKAATPPPTRFERFTKALLAVPERELKEQKEIYEREKRQRRGGGGRAEGG